MSKSDEAKGVSLCRFDFAGIKGDDMLAIVDPDVTAFVRGDTAYIVDCRRPEVECRAKNPKNCPRNRQP